MNLLSADLIAFAIIKELGRGLSSEKQKNKLAELEIALKNDQENRNRFNLDLASAFLDIGQNVIANYIRGDEAELERRRYYNSKNNGYDVYTRMFAVALKLSQADRYYSTKAEVFLHYFSGLALRLKIPVTEKADSLIELALAEQKKALALETHAAYIYNELGVLYQYKKMYLEAERYYLKASQLSPEWAIPQSNLSGVSIDKKEYNKALAYADKADSLQKDLQSIGINRGFVNERNGNLLFAEEYYHHAIDINSRHFLPFERLGYVNMRATNYAVADSFFYEADLRKKGYHFSGNEWELGPDKQPVTPVDGLYCNVDSSILAPTDLFAFFTWGVQLYREQKYTDALRILRKVVAIEISNPLIYHYLGKLYYDQQKWEEAEVMFKLAIKYSKTGAQFKLYADSVISSKKYNYDHDCFEEFFIASHYRQVNDYYFLGSLYQNWKHLEEAEKYFKMITRFDVITYDAYGRKVYEQNRIEIQDYEKISAYVKLWRLLEQQGRYIETEEVMKTYGTISISGNNADRELNGFYRRMIDRFPDNGEWPYRLGNLLYKYAPATTRLPYLDSIVRFPLLNKEILIDSAVYMQLGSDDSLALYDETETGLITTINSSGKISTAVFLSDHIQIKRWFYFVPGTGERILHADAIYFPRKDGITYLQRAAELLSEKETLADIHFKTGNIFLWAGSKKQAYPYFEKSLSLVPDNANARLTLVDIYKALYKNSAAFNQLNYLNDSSQINFEKRMLLAKFDIYAGNFDKANELLNKAEFIYPYVLPVIDNLRGLSNMLHNKPKDAISFYKKSIAAQKDDPWLNNYTLARLYAKTGNTNEALKYLDAAIKRGFNYSYVLQNDSYMESLRKTTEWKTMIANMPKKGYKKTKP